MSVVISGVIHFVLKGEGVNIRAPSCSPNLGRDALPLDPRQRVRGSSQGPVYRLRWSMHCGASGRRLSGTRLWTCCAGRAGTRIRSEATTGQRLQSGTIAKKTVREMSRRFAEKRDFAIRI